ncbi:MAG: hypothetical protein U5L09_13745 [Bacteroidales bacterium]|nr:hypothetical protein [Bacteroidales bacterium]
MLITLGFSEDKAHDIASKIAHRRGAGHAWAPKCVLMCRYRTRIGDDGADYKGYNIAVHEFGHNVEQTISLYDVDHYMLNGVPNTAFTEALAFIFQKRDLELLGMEETNPDKEHLRALDNLWSSYEIMGVSLVDRCGRLKVDVYNPLSFSRGVKTGCHSHCQKSVEESLCGCVWPYR